MICLRCLTMLEMFFKPVNNKLCFAAQSATQVRSLRRELCCIHLATLARTWFFHREKGKINFRKKGKFRKHSTNKINVPERAGETMFGLGQHPDNVRYSNLSSGRAVIACEHLWQQSHQGAII